jgi:DNA-binding winged helix-turn-helix (wHTH) protein
VKGGHVIADWSDLATHNPYQAHDLNPRLIYAAYAKAYACERACHQHVGAGAARIGLFVCDWIGTQSMRLSERCCIDYTIDCRRIVPSWIFDYVTKPFGTRELLTRLRVALRHGLRTPEGEQTSFQIGRWRIDIAKRQIINNAGEQMHLTPLEYRLLEILNKHAGMVVTHRHLLQQAWGPDRVEQTHYLRGYIKQLREKLEDNPSRPRYLLTETGVGYRLLLEEKPSSE